MSLAIQALISVQCQRAGGWLPVATIARETSLATAIVLTQCQVMAELGRLELREHDGGAHVVRLPQPQDADA